jgi:hypothetical protein
MVSGSSIIVGLLSFASQHDKAGCFFTPTALFLAVQKEDGSRWHGEFSSNYIEEVTHKTGNFKKFSVFVKMLGTSLKQVWFPYFLCRTFASMDAQESVYPISDTRLWIISDKRQRFCGFAYIQRPGDAAQPAN